MNDVIALTNDGGRAVGTKGHHNARQHINSRLTNLGVSNYSGNSFLLPYGPSSKGFANVIAMIPGADPSKAPVLLGAHFDTCGDFPGADDNAAAEF